MKPELTDLFRLWLSTNASQRLPESQASPTGESNRDYTERQPRHVLEFQTNNLVIFDLLE